MSLGSKDRGKRVSIFIKVLRIGQFIKSNKNLNLGLYVSE